MLHSSVITGRLGDGSGRRCHSKQKGISRPVNYGISYEQVEAMSVPMLSSIGEVDKKNTMYEV
jgi:hypothetical protein